MSVQQIMVDVHTLVQTLLAVMLAPVVLALHWILTIMDA